MNPVPTSPLADDIGTAPTGPVAVVIYIPFYTHSKFKQNAAPELVFSLGARCSSVVRAFAHGAMGRRIDPSWWTH